MERAEAEARHGREGQREPGVEGLSSRRELWLRKLVYPGHTLPTAVGPVLVGTALAVHGGAFAPVPAAAALLAGWLVQLGGVIADNHQNLARHRNDREHPALVAALREGILSLEELRRASAACYVLALLPGLYLIRVGGPTVLLIGIAGALASWIYSGGPWPLKYHGLSEGLFFLFFSPVSVAGTHYVQAAASAGAAFPPLPPAGSLPAELYGPWILLPLLALPESILLGRYVLTHHRHEELVPASPRAGRLMLAYCVLLAVGLAVPAGGS